MSPNHDQVLQCRGPRLKGDANDVKKVQQTTFPILNLFVSLSLTLTLMVKIG